MFTLQEFEFGVCYGKRKKRKRKSDDNCEVPEEIATAPSRPEADPQGGAAGMLGEPSTGAGGV